MPELPEVETVRSGLAPVMEGQTFRSVEQRRANLRFPFPKHFSERLEGCVVEKMGRRAKYLQADLSSGESLIMHLGMSGRFSILESGQNAAQNLMQGLEANIKSDAKRLDSSKHDHVIFNLSSDTRIIYTDPRRFGFMQLWKTEDIKNYPLYASMGPEPLSTAFTIDYLQQAMGSRAPIKSALLDQKRIAGLGNIYVCEALFRAGIHPERRACEVKKKALALLHQSINDVIAEAINAGGSTLRDYAKADGSLGYFQHRFRVYGREGAACLTCQTQIERLMQSGRSTFFCPKCQK